MRVLWFSTNQANYKSASKSSGSYNGGGWTSSLQDELTKVPEITLGICFCKDNEPNKVEQDGVTYYPIASHKKSIKDKIIDAICIHDIKRDEILWPYYIEKFKAIISDFKPDVIEVFGSELYVGLATIAAKEMRVPCCLHIQGLLSLIFHTFLPPGVSKWNFYLSNGLKGLYANWQYLAYWHRSVYREKAILNAVPHVIGRTNWDKRALNILNPDAQYHYGGEILRSCFYLEGERHIPKQPVIVTTSSGATYKGFDLVLKIANILKNEIGLDFIWKVYGNVNPQFFEKLTGIRHENVNVQLCGVASAEQLREAMLHATVYLQPSYVENSPNSIAEAQILGLPVVATNVGGTSSMIDDRNSGLLFPCTDPYMGAYCIYKLLNDNSLNLTMGIQGKRIAQERHNPKIITTSLIHIYERLIAKNVSNENS